MSAIPMSGVVDRYDRRSAIRCLENGDVLIFSSGTGNPFFTTDSAASLRAIEINAELMIKATKVDGVYDDDPMKNENALKYDTLSYDDVLQKKLRVMDSTAICLCRDQNMPICVFKMEKPGALINIIEGKDEGTLIK
jgi:uridylate kinase